MGNCQAAEAATVLIQHPCGRVERMYWSVSANQVMTSNPGHYVAVIITTTTATTSYTSNCSSSSSTTSNAAPPVKYLKLLRPDDTLHLGHVYRLVSFQEVLKEFATKKHVKLSRLLVGNKDQKTRSKRETEAEAEARVENTAERSAQAVDGQVDAEAAGDDRPSSSGTRTSGPVLRTGQWRPALQSIAETGS